MNFSVFLTNYDKCVVDCIVIYEDFGSELELFSFPAKFGQNISRLCYNLQGVWLRARTFQFSRTNYDKFVVDYIAIYKEFGFELELFSFSDKL